MAISGDLFHSPDDLCSYWSSIALAIAQSLPEALYAFEQNLGAELFFVALCVDDVQGSSVHVEDPADPVVVNTFSFATYALQSF